MSIMTVGDELRTRYVSGVGVYVPVQLKGVIQKVHVFAQARKRTLLNTGGNHRDLLYSATFAKREVVHVHWEEEGVLPAKIVGFVWFVRSTSKIELRAEVRSLDVPKARDTYLIGIECLQKKAPRPSLRSAPVEPKEKKRRLSRGNG